MYPHDAFTHCPRCGSARPDGHLGKIPLECATCGFTYFFNPTVSAAAFIFNPRNEVLVIERAREPAKGMLAVPGGFIDIGETAEIALQREIQEEVGLSVTAINYLCSETNQYPYRGLTYPVCDLVFTAQATNAEAVQALEDVAGWFWTPLAAIPSQRLAFPSLRRGLTQLLS